MAPRRQLPKEVIAIFDKYASNNVRTLSEPNAINMLVNEFSLKPKEAEMMFQLFDSDKNGKMSIWEFQQFFTCVGENANAWVEKFKEMDRDQSGQLDLNEAMSGLKDQKTSSTGREISDNEMIFLLKQSAGPNSALDLAEFINLLCRLKVYK